MTQPIQEPTTQRSVSRLTWGENQLQRRPAPTTEFDLPWIVLKSIDSVTGQQTFPDLDSANIIFQYVCNDYPDTFDATEFTPGMNDWFQVDILEDGLYSFGGNIAYVDPVTTFPEHSIEVFGVDPDGGFLSVRSYPQLAAGSSGPNFSGTDTWEGTWRLEAGQSLACTFYNTDVSDVDMNLAYFEVRKLGSATMGGRDRQGLCGS